MNELDPRLGNTSFLVIGKDVPRTDAVPKVTGTAQYVADLHFPGMLHAAVLRSPHPHARIASIDTSAAAAMPGVKVVVTGEDTAKRKWGAFRPDLYPLAIGKVRYVGDEVAAVAAVDPETARAAVDKIVVRYEVLPAALSLDRALADGAPLVHDDAAGNIAHQFTFERGDVDAGFKQADITVEGTWESARQWHTALETIGCVARWDNERVTMWCNTQTPFLARGRYSVALGLPESRVRVVQTEVGGGFGGKSGDDNASVICALLARKSGRPVKLIHTREEEFLASHPRMPMRYWVRLGFRKDGRVVAKEIRMWADNGAYTGKSQAILGAASVRHDALYKYPCVRGTSTLVYTNLVPTGAFRGFGNPSADWAVEQAWDLAAEKLHMDVFDLLKLNAVNPGDVSPHNHKITSCELKQCLDKASALIRWKEKRRKKSPNREQKEPARENKEPARENKEPVREIKEPARENKEPARENKEPARENKEPARGLGLGCSVHVNGRRSFGDWDGSTAIVRVNEDGRATVITGEGEIGQGNLTVLRQIAAEELGLPYEHVDITRPDTDLHSHSLGALASRLTYVAGNAVKNAASSAAKQLLEAAAEQLKRPASELTILNGEIGPHNGSESEFKPVGAIVRANIYKPGGQPIVGVGNFDNPSEFPDHNRYGNESGAYNFIAQAAEVEVDRTTGEVKVLEIASAVDCGTVINPATAVGQVQGGVMQGLGLAMTEYFDWWNGQPTDPQLKDYPIPGAAMVPKLHVAFADSYEPSGPFGAKGLGEIGLDAVPAVIANAIADAVGVRIYQLPITAEKIHRALNPELYAGETPAPATEPKGGTWSRIAAGRPSGARPFAPEFVHATSVEDAVRHLAAGEAALVCGGMSHALRRERTGFPQAKKLVSIGRIPELNEMTIDARGTLRAGAAVRQQALYEEPRVKRHWRAIDDAMEAVGHTRIRHMLTVGGSLGPLIGGFDLPLALLALDARITVAGPAGRRTIKLAEAFQKRFAKDEMVVGFEVDTPPARSGSSFYKYMARQALEIPTVNTAAAVSLNADGNCAAARVCIGAVGWKPIVLDLKALSGQKLSEDLLRGSVQDVRKLAEPVSDVRGSAAYKREMAVEFAYRALATALKRCSGK